jgi:NAD+ synthase
MEYKRKIINPEAEIENIVGWIKRYFINNGNEDTKAVIGISGGKDSTIAAALLVRALGADRVVGVLMPNGGQKDIADAHEICDTLGIQKYIINIGAAYSELLDAFIKSTNFETNDRIKTNTPPRLRMTTLYMVAGAVGGRVVNTGNASELYLGFTTKFGDLAGDLAIFKNYYVREVLEIGRTMPEIPRYLVDKAPGDGLTGKTDEDNFGFTYKVLDDLLIDKIEPDYDTYRNIMARHKNNRHKDDINLPAPHPRRFIEGEIYNENNDFSF